ncbi:hypothetical protein M378DRAFT_191514 [Amanita muscaria Koide BX008]|uniref:Vacuolar sorting protein 39/Transforming growth factor beta receptor-associated domain-containing protein n=1 Tax=Amanita muscaria (strain Koide BX008) TaxID=946122 RepID=A0A0C2TKD7_AMAMK|nr:hypothetical protein M378DRAFT_191514 [Amanita muscaria Koide BX008]
MATPSSTFPRCGVLVLGSTSIQSLVPSTLITQVESLLDAHKIEDAVDLADQRRKKLQAEITVNVDEIEELHYVYQRIGFQCFTETLFEDAGKHLFDGDLDPRLLISYYPHLRGNLFSPDDAVDVFHGVADRMPTESSVEDIVRNYSPHLAPDTRTAPPAVELRKILVMAAEEMLESFLRRWRVKKKVDGELGRTVGKGKGKVNPCFPVVDTVLVKLYTQFEKTDELHAFLQEPNFVVLQEVEGILIATQQFSALRALYKSNGDDLKLLDLYSRIIDGRWKDEQITNPVSEMVALLQEKKDRALTQKWAIWLLRQDPERGIKLLITKDTGKRKERPEEDIALLGQIQEANAAAGQEYLEYLVLQRKSSVPELHTQLALNCTDKVISFLENETVSKLWRAKASSYASSQTSIETQFLSYFSSTTPDSDHKRARLKLILFLAGSSLYDPLAVKSRLEGRTSVLGLEFAILDAKLGDHRSVLTTLVHEIRDTASAELYCTLGGDVVSRRVAVAVAESCGLQAWTSGLFYTASSGAARSKEGDIDEEKKQRLLRLLLEVHMNDPKGTPVRMAKLLNSQAVNLDTVDVISLVPPNWPLQVLSSFLARSFRRTVHLQREGTIVKNISAGQNLEVQDRTWHILREEGYDLEEEIETPDEDEFVYDEKGALVEKLAAHTSHEREVHEKRGLHDMNGADDVGAEDGRTMI